MKSARVFHVVTNLNLGGAQTSVSLITSGLRSAGIDVQVVHSSSGGRDSLRHAVLPDRLRRAGVPVHDIRDMYRDVKLLSDLKAYRQLRSLFATHRPDIVHTHMSKAGILGRWAARSAGVPIVVHSVRGWAFQGSFSPLMRKAFMGLERLLAKKTDLLAAVSHRTVADGLEQDIGSAEQYTVVRTGIDTGYFMDGDESSIEAARSSLGIPVGAPVIGTVMGITPQKAPFDLLAACADVLVSRPDTHVVVVGDGELREEFQHRITAAGMDDRFHITGLQEDVRPFLRMLDVFLLASLWEGLPRVVLEALAAGIPVVATSAGGTEELLGWTDLLSLVEPGAVTDLGREVLSRLDGTGSTDRSSPGLPEEFHISTVVNRHIELYRDLIGKADLDLLI